MALAAALAAGLVIVATLVGFGVGGPGLLSLEAAVVGLVGAVAVAAAVEFSMLYLVPHSLRLQRESVEAQAEGLRASMQELEVSIEGRMAGLEEDVLTNRTQMQALVRRETDVFAKRLDGAFRSTRNDFLQVRDEEKKLLKDLKRVQDDEQRIREELLQHAIEVRNADHRIEDKVRVLEEAVARESEEIETLYARVPDDEPSRPVSEVEGISARDVQRLKRLGIKSIAQLQRADGLRLARELNTWPNQVRHWQAMAALMEVDGIGPHYAEALDAAGIHDVHELSEADAQAVVEQIRQSQDGKAGVRPVSAEHVKAWIREARRMEQHA